MKQTTPELLPDKIEGAPPDKAGDRLDADRIIALAEKAAADPTVDVNKMERILAMVREVNLEKARREFNAAMQVVQRLIPPIIKDSLNPSTNSRYAKLDQIQKVVTPILLENGFAISFGTDQSNLPDHYGVTCLLTHAAGYERTYRCDVPCDNLGPKGMPSKTKTHGFGSAISYGERYLTKLIFNIRLVGEDDDGNFGNKPKPPGPSTMTPDNLGLKELARELWNVLKPVRGTAPNWAVANSWMWREEILDGAVPEEAPHLSPERMRKAIADAKKKLTP